MIARRQYYGWYDSVKKEYRVSKMPPDSPIRPSVAYFSKESVRDAMAQKRADVYWWPPLPLGA